MKKKSASLRDLMKKGEKGFHKLVYFWPAKNRFYISNQMRQKLAHESRLPDGRIKTTWFAFEKIPSTCILIGKFD